MWGQSRVPPCVLTLPQESSRQLAASAAQCCSSQLLRHPQPDPSPHTCVIRPWATMSAGLMGTSWSSALVVGVMTFWQGAGAPGGCGVSGGQRLDIRRQRSGITSVPLPQELPAVPRCTGRRTCASRSFLRMPSGKELPQYWRAPAWQSRAGDGSPINRDAHEVSSTRCWRPQ